MMVFVGCLVAACGDDGSGGGVPIDGSLPNVHVPPQCPALPDKASFNFFGESCVEEAPYPANTLCQGDAGWCIDGVCRPQAGIRNAPSCEACPAGTRRYAPAGASYCSPT
jgi:hypothetical protein